MSFYRTYRPQVIAEIDNPDVREWLLSLLHKEKAALPHAFLFTGPKGTGKTTAARLIAKVFNCTKPTKQGPCGKCDQCIATAQGRNLDVVEIDAASNRGIDEIRILRERIALVPISASYKVYIIDEVHMLTAEAFNALLKTLEEPPAHAVFVLATTEAHKVPATIASRCITIPFARATEEAILHALSRIVKRENLTVAPDALAAIAQRSEGSFRDAVKLLEQASFTKHTITLSLVTTLLALSGEETKRAFLQSLKKRDAKAALAVVGRLVTEGADIRAFTSDLLSLLHNELVDLSMGKKGTLFERQEVTDLIRRFVQAWSESKMSPIAELPLELAAVEYCETSAIAEEKKSTGAPAEGNVSGSTSRASPLKEYTPEENVAHQTTGVSLTLARLSEYWKDVIAAVKPYNHSLAGVLRSSRPKAVGRGIVTIEAFYPFHKEKLSEIKNREAIAQAVQKLLGEKVRVEVVVGRK